MLLTAQPPPCTQVGMLSQHLGALEAEYEALRDEFRAVTDDLEAMVKENQVGGWLVEVGGRLVDDQAGGRARMWVALWAVRVQRAGGWGLEKCAYSFACEERHGSSAAIY